MKKEKSVMCEMDSEKEIIANRLENPDELGIPIIMKLNYPTNLAKYQRDCEEREKYEKGE